MSEPVPQVLTTVAALLAGAKSPPWPQLVATIARHFDCPVATIHVLGDDGLLHLAAQQGLPPPVLDKVQVIPIGKGMAGIAAERKEAVQVCNLQADDSGVVRPGAKLTQMQGSIAAPMLVDGEVRGVLGVAKPSAYEFSAAETTLLLALAATLGRQALTP
jgi:L-methionine (R)-S-oxide reductase